MRIIAGEAGGRQLKSIKGTTTRPTLDRVKEAVFNMIGYYLPGTVGLDLFAGFGSLGLEALSRGAESITFVEKDYRNIKVIKENIKLCKFNSRAVVRCQDVFKFVKWTEDRFDLVMMDPPYGQNLAGEAVNLITAHHLLTRGALMVVEHGKSDVMPDLPELNVIKSKNYGDTGITIYQAGGRDEV